MLLPIIAQARAGALGQAWRLFREAGYESVTDDPAILCVRGRLLKDEAGTTSSLAQRRLYKQSARAYERAATLNGQTYPLINAATLSLFSGEPRKAKALARKVLELGEDREESPYWREATRAEALLLLGETAEARHALRQAVTNAPKAIEEHASTLRQFGLILDETKQDKAWLDEFRPPRCLHFAGPLALARDEEKPLAKEIRSVLREERIGAGYGALAAGSDLLIAEALLEADAQLHVVLPAPVHQFRETSVRKYGSRWSRRFEKVLKAADSCRCLPDDPDAPLPLLIRLAAEIAMGRTTLQARVLETEAVHLSVFSKKSEAEPDPSCSAWMASQWRLSGRRERVLQVRAIGARAVQRKRRAEHMCLAAMLRIELPDDSPEQQTKLLRRLSDRLAHSRHSPLVPPRWTGEGITVAYRTVVEARDAISAVRRRDVTPELRIAGHYGIAQRLMDPFSRASYLFGHSQKTLRRIAISTPAGAFHASEDFAAVLAFSDASSHTEQIGELSESEFASPMRLFCVR